MLVVETVSKIRRMHFAQSRSIRSISRELGISKNTVRKVVRGGATEHRYAGRQVQPRPKLEGYVLELEGLLEANAGRNRRDRPAIKAIWGQLRDLGCEAGYDAVRRYAGQWSAEPAPERRIWRRRARSDESRQYPSSGATSPSGSALTSSAKRRKPAPDPQKSYRERKDPDKAGHFCTPLDTGGLRWRPGLMNPLLAMSRYVPLCRQTRFLLVNFRA